MADKVCITCLLPKNEIEFNWRSKTKGTRSSVCKACHKTYRDNHYRENKPKRLIQAKTRRKRQTKVLHALVLDYLSKHPCLDCGENDPVVLDFDHRSDKEFSISNYLASGGSQERLESEIAKCDVRCANCHRRKTAKDFGYQRFHLAGQSGIEPEC